MGVVFFFLSEIHKSMRKTNNFLICLVTPYAILDKNNDQVKLSL